MLTDFDKKEYSSHVLEILNSKPYWFIRHGTMFVLILLASLLFASNFITVENNISIKIIFFKLNNNKNNFLKNISVAKHNILINCYVNKLLQLGRFNKNDIYAILVFPNSVKSKINNKNKILIEIQNLPKTEKIMFNCSIISADIDSNNDKKILIARINLNNINKYITLGKVTYARIILKNTTLYDKFRIKVKLF